MHAKNSISVEQNFFIDCQFLLLDLSVFLGLVLSCNKYKRTSYAKNYHDKPLEIFAVPFWNIAFHFVPFRFIYPVAGAG